MYNEDQPVKIKWLGRTKKHYESLGYTYTGINTVLEIPLKHLLPNSNERVPVICDVCGDEVMTHFRNYNRIVERDGYYHCKPCTFAEAMQRRDERSADREYQVFLDTCKVHDCTPITTKEEFTGAEMEMYYICPVHGLQHTQMGRITHGAWCYWCGKDSMKQKQKLTKEDIVQIVASKNNNQLLNPDDYINHKTSNLQIICGSCGETFVTSLGALRNGDGHCPNCARIVQGITARLSEEEILRRTTIRGRQMMVDPDSYQRGNEIRGFHCTVCDAIFTTNVRNYLRGFTRCSRCSLAMSRGEEIIRDTLEALGIEYVYQKAFDDCRDKLPLPFDFYLPDRNWCIEFHGDQHFQAIDFFGGEEQYKIRQRHDAIKEEYCYQHHIRLIIIPSCEMDHLSYLVETIIKQNAQF